ncbi:MAG: NAD(P)/FAD-dependent oxidoreductase [bacterium]|jgi:NADH dehydrogenase
MQPGFRTHNVVIVGGGFGGLNAAMALRKAPAQVTLLDRNNYHLFQPLLYQVATGSLSPGDITATLRPLFRDDKNITTLLAEVADIDLANRRLILKDGELAYDTLVLAPGSGPSYFGHDEWADVAPPLKSIENATEIRRRWLLAFENAERETDSHNRRRWLTFVIVGAGPTGVELAGALGEIARDTLRGDFRTVRPEEARIWVLEAEDRILPAFPERLAWAAERELAGLGVQTLTGARVTSVERDGVTFDIHGEQQKIEGQRIEARTIIWAAGVKPSPLARSLERAGARLERGRVVVRRDCTLPGHPEVFVIGDLAHFSHGLRAPLPGLAPVALQQGRFVGRVIKARLEKRRAPGRFKYYDKGDLAVIGRGKAVGVVSGKMLEGMPAWLAWVFVHLAYIIGFENRLLIFIQWAFYYVTYNRRARIITRTGEPAATRAELQGEPPKAA